MVAGLLRPKFKPAGTYPEPDRPNQVWEIDHTRADIFTWDDIILKRVLARAWITVIIDEKDARANPDLIKEKAQLCANLATKHKQKRVRPGGSKKARLLGNNLEGALRAVANGELAGAVPAWATPAALLDETTMTGDGWPVFREAKQVHPKFSGIFPDASHEQDAGAAERSAQTADASAMADSGAMSTAVLR